MTLVAEDHAVPRLHEFCRWLLREHADEVEIAQPKSLLLVLAGGLMQQFPSHGDPADMQVGDFLLEELEREHPHARLARSRGALDQDAAHCRLDAVTADVPPGEHVGGLGHDPPLVVARFHVPALG